MRLTEPFGLQEDEHGRGEEEQEFVDSAADYCGFEMLLDHRTSRPQAWLHLNTHVVIRSKSVCYLS